MPTVSIVPEEIERFVAAALSPAKPKLIVGNRMNDVARDAAR